jgi:hypothetical protein
MKQIALFSIAIVIVVIGSACERHPATKLPLHYQHKMHADSGDHSHDAHGKEAAKH